MKLNLQALLLLRAVLGCIFLSKIVSIVARDEGQAHVRQGCGIGFAIQGVGAGARRRGLE